MALLPQRRQPWTELLPDGRTVQDAYSSLLSNTQPPPPIARPRTPPFGGGQAGIGPTPMFGTGFGAPAAAPVAPAAPTPPPLPNADLANDLPAGIDAAPPTEPPTIPYYPGNTKSSVPTGGLSSVGKAMARLQATKDAPLNADVTVRPDGTIDTGYAKPMTRRHMALMGLLQGALAGGAAGGWRGALGGAATGAVAGGVSPKLIGALERQQEEARLQGDVTDAMKNEMGAAQIGDVQAQTTQRDLQPIIEQYKLEQQQAQQAALEAGRNTRAAATEEGRNTRSTARIAALTERQHQQEAQRRAAATRPQYRIDSSTGDIVEITPGQAGAAGTVRTIHSGTKAHVQAGQAQALYDKASADWDDAVNKRDAADKLQQQIDALDPVDKALGADKDLTKRRDALVREAEGIETKVRANQLKGDELRAQSQAADSTGPTAPTTRAPKGRGGRRSNSAGSQRMGISRATFRANNPAATQGKSDAEVDALIHGGGYTPLP